MADSYGERFRMMVYLIFSYENQYTLLYQTKLFRTYSYGYMRGSRPRDAPHISLFAQRAETWYTNTESMEIIVLGFDGRG